MTKMGARARYDAVREERAVYGGARIGGERVLELRIATPTGEGVTTR